MDGVGAGAARAGSRTVAGPAAGAAVRRGDRSPAEGATEAGTRAVAATAELGVAVAETAAGGDAAGGDAARPAPYMETPVD